MKNLMAPNVLLALVLLAMAAAALRAAAKRPEPQQPPGTRLAPVTAIAGQSQPQPPVIGRHNGIGGEMAGPPAPPGRPANAIDQAQRIFHELHADGRHTSCEVCDSQYGTA